MTTSTLDADEIRKRDAIRITIPPRYLALVGGGVTVGAVVGVVRGGRAASLRFLAENAHRPPRTVRGWYLYNKTKNYRVMLGGLRRGGWEALRLGGLMGVWAGLEAGIERVGWGDVKEVGAGLGTAGVFAGLGECFI